MYPTAVYGFADLKSRRNKLLLASNRYVYERRWMEDLVRLILTSDEPDVFSPQDPVVFVRPPVAGVLQKPFSGEWRGDKG